MSISKKLTSMVWNMLAINEEFYSVQGEGKNTGVLQYFVRTQGCAVGCYFCDTKYTWKESDATVKEEDIVKRAKQHNAKWVCITGGEPLEQDLTKLVTLLKQNGIKTQLETSGMYYSPIVKEMDWVCCSPKMLYSKKKYDDRITDDTHEVKCVVTDEKELKFYVGYFIHFEGVKTFQPVDSDIAKISKMILKHNLTDWNIMLQQHKVLELR